MRASFGLLCRVGRWRDESCSFFTPFHFLWASSSLAGGGALANESTGSGRTTLMDYHAARRDCADGKDGKKCAESYHRDAGGGLGRVRYGPLDLVL